MKNLRGRCRIDRFVLVTYRSSVDRYIQGGSALPSNKDTSGFKKIAEQLSEIVAGGADKCSCTRCEKIGDAVIALDADRQMQLEHTDRSHDTCAR